MRRLILVLTVLAALAAVGAAAADGPALTGVTGPGFTITLRDASGQDVHQLAPGAYALTIQDLSDEHDFHLTGPGGVDVITPVEGTGTRSVQLTLVDGTYDFICDAHPTRMKGSFTVGAAPAPAPTPTPTPTPTPKPAAVKLVLRVTDAAVTLRTAAGGTLRRLQAGLYTISVVDRSKTQSAHLVAPGVNRKTGIAFVGTVTWTVRLRAAGTVSIRSDAVKTRLRAVKLPLVSA